MLLHKSVVADSRVRREARALVAAGHEVTIVHVPPPDEPRRAAIDGARLVAATPPARLRRLPLHAHRLLMLALLVARALRARPQVVHAHDAAMLLPALAVRRLCGARVLYDSHEYALGVPYRTRGWALLVRAVEGGLIRRCAAVVTVSDGIARLLQERYRLRRRPAVVRNLPDRAVLGARGRPDGEPTLRAALGIGAAPLVLHQGAPAEHRGCEQLIAAVARLDGVHLLFLGDGEPGFQRRLADAAAAHGASERVHFAPAVPLERLLAATAEADVGVSLLEATCENHRRALPNKVFEYLAAEVPVVVNDLPELRALVREHGVGWVADGADPRALAAVLAEALAGKDDPRLRRRVATAGAELTWERERRRLLAVYDALAASAPRR